MERFMNQPLSQRPHLAVFGSDKVGDFVVTTPLLRGLKEKYAAATLDFFGSATTCDLEAVCPYIDARFSLYGGPQNDLGELNAFVAARRARAGNYDLAINCDEFSELSLVAVAAVAPGYLVGASLQPDFRCKLPPGDSIREQMLHDDDWNSIAFLNRYRRLLTSNYLAEILCRLAYVETDFFRLEVGWSSPPFAVPEVLLHLTATRRAKQWVPEYWRTVISWCKARGLSVGVIGSNLQIERARYHSSEWEEQLIAETGMQDLRGATTLPVLAGAFRQARAAVVVDAGPMHLAAAVSCPTVCIFGNDYDGDGASPINLWAPRGPQVYLVRTPVKCTVCVERRFKNEVCLIAGHPCMRELQPERVIAALERALECRQA